MLFVCRKKPSLNFPISSEPLGISLRHQFQPQRFCEIVSWYLRDRGHPVENVDQFRQKRTPTEATECSICQCLASLLVCSWFTNFSLRKVCRIVSWSSRDGQSAETVNQSCQTSKAKRRRNLDAELNWAIFIFKLVNDALKFASKHLLWIAWCILDSRMRAKQDMGWRSESIS